jgi:hypothetical protein
MTVAAPRSPRAEKARDWFWTTFGVAAIFNVCIQVFGMDVLNHGWGLAPRILVSVVWLISGAVWAWETCKRRRDHGGTYYSGSLRNVPIDLDALARDREEASCHTCDMPADVIMQMLDEESNIGSAIFLRDEDAALVSRRDVDAISQRMARNYTGLPSEMTETASLMVYGRGRSVRLAGR